MIMRLSPSVPLIFLSTAPHLDPSTAFSPVPRQGITPLPHHASQTSPVLPHALLTRQSRLATSNPNDPDDPSSNPYSDPNYPDLEFVNYNDPEYETDQGDELSSSSLLSEEETLAEIESMRESRRRRNDEYQFETYHSQVLRGGEVTLGEWTVFQTDTFLDGMVREGAPRLVQWKNVLKVVSRGSKVVIDSGAEWRVDGERIVHEERLADVDDFPIYMETEEEVESLLWDEEDGLHVERTFWPKEMEAEDFRGPGGNMCVGKAYTICDAVPLDQWRSEDINDRHEGPFREMRTELGLQDNGMRYRIKLDYALLEDVKNLDNTIPPLHLRTLTVCRETLDGYWPNRSDNDDVVQGDEIKLTESAMTRRNQQDITNALFGPAGAPGGLYDPPPVGSETRAVQNYMLLDFEGGATVLLPHRLDQQRLIEDGESDGVDTSYGWVTSLDWTPGKIRYQVDRKVMGGTKLKGLKTLELSEVMGKDADRWRPTDGGANMRQ